MEYKIVEAITKYKLSDEVNGFILQGWKPYGIPFLVDHDCHSELNGGATSLGSQDTWNQTMVRLSVKDEEGDDPEWTELREAEDREYTSESLYSLANRDILLKESE